MDDKPRTGDFEVEFIAGKDQPGSKCGKLFGGPAPAWLRLDDRLTEFRRLVEFRQVRFVEVNINAARSFS